jgi:hypothetical protein
MTVEEAFVAYTMQFGTPTYAARMSSGAANSHWLKGELDTLRVLGQAQDPPINAIRMFSKLQDYEILCLRQNVE